MGPFYHNMKLIKLSLFQEFFTKASPYMHLSVFLYVHIFRIRQVII